MKQSLKRTARTLWRKLGPIHRPLLRKAGGWIGGIVEGTVTTVLERRVRPALDSTTAAVRDNIDRTDDVLQYLRRSAQENTLLLDSLVRELIRVQMQIETLETLVADLGADGSGRTDLYATISDEDSPAERLMIG
jgi:uncharacterized protein YeeX (DUF496 family)